MSSSLLCSELIRGGFGKLPSQPDFVRVAAGGREILALDQWLQEGLYYARRELGPEWEPLYDARLHHRFVFRPDNCGYTVVGVMRAAIDVLERRFPFVAFALVPTQRMDFYPQLAAPLFDGLYRELEATIEQVATVSELSNIRSRLERLTEPPALSGAALERYAVFLDEVRCDELCPEEGPTQPLEEVISLLGHVHMHPRRLSLPIELPLRQPTYSRSLEIRFWIELCMLLLQWYPPTFSMFWHSGSLAVRGSALVVSFRHPPGALLGALLERSGRSRSLWRPGKNQPFPGSNPRTQPLPVRGSDSLRLLLEAVCPGYPDTCRWSAF